MKTNRALLISASVALALFPVFVQANSGDFSGGVAIGTSYAGVDAAPTNGLIVQGEVGIGTSAPGDSLDLGQNTDAITLPSGTNAQRPTAANGMVRYNSSITGLEAYYGSAWNQLVQTTSPVVTGISSDTYTATGSTAPAIGLYAPATNTVGLSARSLPVIEGTNPASAVNYVIVTGAATGTNPSISPTGSDTNIGLNLTPKGTGNVIVTSGALGIGSTSPAVAVDVVGSIDSTANVTAAALIPTSATVPTSGLYAPSATSIALATNSTNALAIDSSQIVLIGGTTSYNAAASYKPVFQINGTTTGTSGLSLQRWSNDSVGPYLVIAKSRGAAVGTDSAVLSGDALASIRATGDDGTNQLVGGQLSFYADGNFTTTSAPTRVSLFVTPSGSTSLAEAVRVESNQHVDFEGPAYTLSGCGTSPTIAGNDVIGRITIGSTPTTACTVVFSAHWTNAPACWCNDETTALNCRASANTVSQVTFNGAFVASDKVSFGCKGYL